MDQPLPKHMLGRPVRFEESNVHVCVSPEVEAVIERTVIDWIEWLLPTGLLRLHPDGKGRCYVDLRCQRGRRERLQVARIILCLLDEPEQKNRQAHYRDQSTFNLLPENLYLGDSAYLSGGDATWQEVARREWARRHGEHPDLKLEEILSSERHPPHKGNVELPVFPPLPIRQALRQRMLKGGRSGDGN